MRARLLTIDYPLRSTRLIWVILCVLATGGQALGQAVLYAAVEKEKVYLGSVFKIEYQLSNAKGQGFKSPDFGEGLEVISGPFSAHQTTIVNGVRESRSTISYQLKAKKLGTYVITPAHIKVGSQDIESNPLHITVLPPLKVEELSINDLSEERPIILRAEMSSDTAYTGQQVTLTYYLFAPKDRPVDRVQLQTMPELTPFDHFYHSPDMGSPDVVDVHGKPYHRYLVRRLSLYAKQSGSYTLLPAQVQLLFAKSTRSFFGRNYEVKYAQSNGLSLTVLSLPTPAPDNFSGAVGRYTVNYRTDQQRLSTDDAVRIGMRIEGDGHPERIQMPTWSHHQDLTSYDPGVDRSNKNEIQGRQVHYTVAEYLYTASAPGRYWVVPSFTIFDVDSLMYRTISKDTLFFEIAPGDAATEQAVVVDTLYQDIGHPPRSARLWSGTLAGRLIWLIVLLIGMGLWLQRYLARRKLKAEEDEYDVLEAQLRSLRSTPEVSQTIYLLADFVRRRLDINADEGDMARISTALTDRGAPVAEVSSFLDYLQRGQTMAYAGQQQDETVATYHLEALTWLGWLRTNGV